MSEDELADLDACEQRVGTDLVAAGKLVHIWRLPGRRANIAIWSCTDTDELHRSLALLPAWPWMDITVRALATHPLGEVTRPDKSL